MSEITDSVKILIENLNDAELQSLGPYLRAKLPRHPLEIKWGITSEVILDAINRSQDITQRGVRGVIAEAVFEANILPQIKGWKGIALKGDLPYDFKIKRESDGLEITIQVKLQRTEKGQPLQKKRYPPDAYIVEVQKTRSGTKKKNKKERNGAAGEPQPENTRPYKFGDFDIIAVNMQPSAGDWSRYMYTVGSWLLPRSGEQEGHLIEIMQPVSAKRSDVWTDDVAECIQWFLSGEKRCVFDLKRANAQYARKSDARRRAKKGAAQGGRLRKK
jgi:hypothetical protein